MIISDYHSHTSFSSDSDADPEDMIRQAVSAGLHTLCITEHMDYDFPKCYELSFEFDPEEYFRKLLPLKEACKKQLNLQIGIEAGVRPYLAERYHSLLSSYPFDFVICSTHLVHDIDPYYRSYWEEHGIQKGLSYYFEEILETLEAFSDFDVYGHLDYVVRYIPDDLQKKENFSFTYAHFSSLIDEILRKIISLGKGIEINTAGYKYGLNRPNPDYEIIKRFRELGGQYITIGSDAHEPRYLAHSFSEAERIIKAAGFVEYAVFEQRERKMLPF